MKYLINIISNVVKVGAGFLFFLLLTNYNTPVELGQLGQLLTFSAAMMMVGTLGIQNKLIQDFSSNLKIIDINYVFSIFLISLFFLVVVLALGNAFFYDISLLYGGNSFAVFFIFVLIIFILAIYIQFKFAMFNGMGNYKRLAKINILGSLFSIFIAYIFLDIFKGKNYQFFLIMAYPCFKVFFMWRSEIKWNLNFKCFFQSTEKLLVLKHIKTMLPFVIMATISITLIYGYQYSIRNLIANKLDWGYVGQWQILQKHSEVVSLLFASLASVFIIPKIAGKTHNLQINVSKTYAIGFFGIGVLSLVVVKLIGVGYINILFGSEYKLAGDLLFIQLIGDLFKVIAYCFTLNVLCNSWVRLYVILEVIQYALLYLSYYLCLHFFDVNYIAHSYSLAYFIFMIFSISFLIFFSKKIKIQNNINIQGTKV
jgi:antigen flippase